ncbi:polysaccharide biosynthesis protein [Leeuwenhoekiella aestuarii]|uniref:polysaccharide biosynthesis protein n=1 Tax=Leeuwenhoekiella aestuarii TaxID=2249426 RepID=UPI000FFE7163|nr:polysaccharide biosynthesis protein [Leeuwenhoekiella aestuarii]
MNSSFFNQIKSHPLYARSQHWTGLISISGTAQVFIMLISLASGILVIRLLSTEEYALYTLANTMLGTIIALANAGIPIGVMSEGGKVWKDKKKMGMVFVTAFELRKIFGLVSLLIGIPILIYLLRLNGASWTMSILIMIGLIPAFFSQISNSILEIAPKLTQHVVPLQKNQLAINTGRLVLLILLIFLFPFAYIAIIASTLPQVWGNIRLKKITNSSVDWEQQSDSEIKLRLVAKTRRILPEAIFYCLSGQLTVWLLSLFGSTDSVAQIGALGRLAMVMNIISVLFGMLIAPRFARLEADFSLLKRRYLQALLLVVVLFLGIIGIVYWFPSQILWILGAKYGDLEDEVVLAVIGSSLNLLSGIIYALYSSRGWIINPFLYIAISISSTIIAMLVLDITTLYGVLLLNIAIAGVQVLTHYYYGLYKLYALKAES